MPKAPTLAVRTALGGRVSMRLPRGFTPMSEGLIQGKYPNGNVSTCRR